MLAAPSYQTCRQGVWADCWLLSALVGLAFKRPGAILDMVADLGDGTYQVTFPGHDPLIVRPDQGSPGTVSDPWPWAPVVEAACQQIMDTTQPRFLTFGIGIELLTGHGRNGYTNALGRGFAPVSRFWSRGEWFRNRLTDAAEKGRLIVLGGSDGYFTTPKQAWVREQHCYAVLDYTRDTDRVRVRDPRGIDDNVPDHPIPPDRKEPGYGPGEFWLAPEEVEASFCGLSIEAD